MQARRRPGGKRTSDRRGGPCHARTLAPATNHQKNTSAGRRFWKLYYYTSRGRLTGCVCVYEYEYRVPSVLYVIMPTNTPHAI